MQTFQLIGRIVVGQEDFVIEPAHGHGNGAVRVFGYKVGRLANGTPRVYLFDSLQDALQWIDGQEVGQDETEDAITREGRLSCDGG
jgi:hypothetical protein